MQIAGHFASGHRPGDLALQFARLAVGFSHWHNAHRVGRFAFAGEMSAGVAEIAICNALLCMNDSAYISTGNLKDTEVPFPNWL